MEIISKGKKVYPSILLSQRGQETVVNNSLSDSFNKVRFWFCRKNTILWSVAIMHSFKIWKSCNPVKK